ncbi:Uncharacterized protein APZ42_006861 [Daphnia magna]|uniref:HAT C-terminal dimerisation domain-containing protein n=1 Tax=Daphnia magna TaxID=35525 RepID=A0A164FNG1_9CRUS|nr:Uncharacterized protein APZ42_006861 [Daphnia magna]
METESGECDILKFWQIHAKRWPELSNMAFDFLTISATSAASERSFSGGKDLISMRETN